MSLLLIISIVVIALALGATAYIAIKANLPPRQRVMRFAVELAVFVLGITILDRTILAFHLHMSLIGRDEALVIVAAYALLTVIPALLRIGKSAK